MSRFRNSEFLVRRCRQGDDKALTAMLQSLGDPLRGILLARGANPTEVDDLIADLWADCVPGSPEQPSLLEKFSGRCSLQGWLATVLTNRWIDLKRKQRRRLGEPALAEQPEAAGGAAEGWETSIPQDEALLELLRESLREAFSKCPTEALAMLRLVYECGLTQRQVCRMLSWTESRVSRLLSSAMEQIQRDTLRSMKARDPWLELSWEDLVVLCDFCKAELW